MSSITSYAAHHSGTNFSLLLTYYLDRRVPFALMMQESTGKVRPIHGDHGASHGMFQVQIPGAPTCDGTTLNTCSIQTITQMAAYGIFGQALSVQPDGSITGTAPTPIAPGIAFWLWNQGGNVGQALRGYNTGRVPDPSDLLQTGGVGTVTYVSDVANRLVGGTVGSPRPYTCGTT